MVIFFSHPQTGGRGTANRLLAKQASRDGEPIPHMLMNEAGKRCSLNHGVLVRLNHNPDFLSATKLREHTSGWGVLVGKVRGGFSLEGYSIWMGNPTNRLPNLRKIARCSICYVSR
jgi:hypothetical protein